MKTSLQPGIRHVMQFTVPESKVVPALYPEAPEFQNMPRVFATGFLVGLLEWACVQAVTPHLDAEELTVGTHIDISHEAATPPGLEVTVTAELTRREGRRLWFAVEAHDGIDRISGGQHQRVVVDAKRFVQIAEGKKRPPGLI